MNVWEVEVIAVLASTQKYGLISRPDVCINITMYFKYTYANDIGQIQKRMVHKKKKHHICSKNKIRTHIFYLFSGENFFPEVYLGFPV